MRKNQRLFQSIFSRTGWFTEEDVLEDTGWTLKEVRRGLARLRENGLIIQRGSYYKLSIENGVRVIREENWLMDEIRHFILFAKGRYGHYSRSEDWQLEKCLKKIMGKVFGLENIDSILEEDIFSALCSTCEEVGLDGYRILRNLIGSNSGVWKWDDVFRTILSELGMVKVKELQEDESYKVIIDLGEIDQSLKDRISPYVTVR